MSRRIMTTENLEEDVRIENHLRPQLLDPASTAFVRIHWSGTGQEQSEDLY